MSLDQKTWIDEALHFGYYSKWHLVTSIQKSVVHMDILSTLKLAQNPIPPNKQPLLPKNVDDYNKQTESLIRGRAPFWGDSAEPKEKIQPFPNMNRGIKFLEEWVGNDQSNPSFLTLSLVPPHFPHHLPEEYVKLAGNYAHVWNFPQTSKTIAMGVLGFTQHLGGAVWTPLPSTKKSGKLSSPIPTLTLPWSTKPSVLSSIDWMTLILLIQNYRFCR